MSLSRPLRILLLGAGYLSACLAQTATAKPRSVWDGIYTKAEADRGAAAYASYCSRCHGQELDRQGGVLIGAKFMEHWREDNLGNLFQTIKDTMPPGQRGRLSEAEYTDILAYILSVNQFPAGEASLVPAEFDRILVVGKQGPGPVPDFALVLVVGCLSRDATGRWMVKSASEPVRTRNPREPTEAELAEARERAAGSHEFRFLDTFEFAKEFKSGGWMEAKGFLIRAPGNDRINLTWLQSLRPSCGK